MDQSVDKFSVLAGHLLPSGGDEKLITTVKTLDRQESLTEFLVSTRWLSARLHFSDLVLRKQLHKPVEGSDFVRKSLQRQEMRFGAELKMIASTLLKLRIDQRQRNREQDMLGEILRAARRARLDFPAAQRRTNPIRVSLARRDVLACTAIKPCSTPRLAASPAAHALRQPALSPIR
jgi:hypothetical protein